MVQLSPFLTRQHLKLSSFTPTKQRASIGLFGLFSQTAIDANNKKVNKETRKHSAVRTAAKIIITTSGGIGARALGQRAGEWLVKKDIIEIPQNYLKEWGAKPQNTLRQEISELTGKSINKIPKKVSIKDYAKTKYGIAIGAATAVVSAAISVFIWDMPFTNKIMNAVMKIIGNKNKNSENS